MKCRTWAALFLLAMCTFILSACGTETAEPAEIILPESSMTMPPQTETVDQASDAFTPSEEGLTEEVLNEYLSEFGATESFRDIYFAEKYWFIGDAQLVEFIVFPEYEIQTIIYLDDTVRVEYSDFSSISYIDVYDRSGACHSLTVYSNEADLLRELLHTQRE